MAKYLIDINLPYYFSLWNNEDYIHQSDISNTAEDTEIWQYAKQNNLTILTKDADFSNRILLSQPPPRVIHIRIGNASVREFHNVLNLSWNDVLALSESHKLVTVFKDRVEAMN
ncbi:DUF5615 family PIN-like protein [Persicitalea jodogahamensis]|uniref:DUF5615 domain-containing protein n=1 Tax=Persicitalea jodogahamensis TaxID=402147 RepID=A0A8J3DCM1_9BACT|nr:DUF5615 family PIN-like protein [Persicitalea jodogahamensis]GHB83079.1 hypothetical protein GCM10007390_42530 [Persicitalea jodogahamensis]